jgi:hypothetical protein
MRVAGRIGPATGALREIALEAPRVARCIRMAIGAW